MDHALKWFALALAIGNVFAQQDPEEILAQARDKLRAAGAVNYSCVETIDRSYFSRRPTPVPPPSCERIHIEREKGQVKLKLDTRDRLRLAVSVAQEREIFSWVKPGPFTPDADVLMHPGLVGTGAFQGYLGEILGDRGTRFQFLGANGKNLDYHFRVPIESSQYFVAAGNDWRAAGYEGRLRLDPATLDVVEVSLETDELPPDTSMCEVRATVELHRDAGRLVPLQAELHNVLRDTKETDSVTTFSDCVAPPPRPVPHSDQPPILPEGLPVKLALSGPIESVTAAVGDPIAATLVASIRDPKSHQVLAPAGSLVTGRILRLEHWFADPARFALAMEFDTIEINGSAAPFYARLDQSSGDETLVFPGRRETFTIRAGFEMNWRTTRARATK